MDTAVSNHPHPSTRPSRNNVFLWTPCIWILPCLTIPNRAHDRLATKCIFNAICVTDCNNCQRDTFFSLLWLCRRVAVRLGSGQHVYCEGTSASIQFGLLTFRPVSLQFMKAEVLMALDVMVFCALALCCLVGSYQRFGGTYASIFRVCYLCCCWFTFCGTSCVMKTSDTAAWARCRDISSGWMASAQKVYLFTKSARSFMFVLAYIISLFHSFWIYLALFFFRSYGRFHHSLCAHHFQLLACFPLPLFHSLLLSLSLAVSSAVFPCIFFPWCVSLSLCTSHIVCSSEFISLIVLITTPPVNIRSFNNHQTCADIMNCCHVSLGI